MSRKRSDWVCGEGSFALVLDAALLYVQISKCTSVNSFETKDYQTVHELMPFIGVHAHILEQTLTAFEATRQ